MSAERTFPYARAVDLLLGQRKMELWLKDEEIKEKGPFCMMVKRCPQYNTLYPMCSRCDYYKLTLQNLEKDLKKRLEKEPNILESKHEITSFNIWDDDNKGVGHALFKTTLGWELAVSQGLGISVSESPEKKICWGTYMLTVKPIDFRGINMNILIKTDKEITDSVKEKYRDWKTREILYKRGEYTEPGGEKKRLIELENRRLIDKKFENYTNFLIRKGKRHAFAVEDILDRKSD